MRWRMPWTELIHLVRGSFMSIKPKGKTDKLKTMLEKDQCEQTEPVFDFH